MASGSSGRAGNSGFDFGSDDILCSYEDYGNQDEVNGTRSDSSIGVNPNKEFNKNRIARTSMFPTTTYSPPEESSFNQAVILTVERTMKKCTEDLMRFLEGISSRLSQLESYCYNLDKSIGEMRSDLVRDHDESESKLKSLEKHIQEVHRSVQILRDKQELADTQKELAKLQFAKKESSSSINAVQNEEKASLPSSEAKKGENLPDTNAQQLAIVPHQAAPQPSLPARPVEYQQPSMAPPPSMPPQTAAQVQAYYLPQIPNQPVPPQTQYLPAQSQLQDLSRVALHPTQSQLQEYSRISTQQTQPQVNQSPPAQSLPPYQQPWPPQQPQQQPVQPPVAVMQQQHIRSQSPQMYSSYSSNQLPSELSPNNSLPVQVSYTGLSQPGSVGAISYAYGAAGRPMQQQPSAQNLKAGFVSPSGDGYVTGAPRPTLLPPGTGYMIFEGEGGRMHHVPPPQAHFQPGAYPPASMALNQQRIPNASMVSPQSPYNALIEKLVSMGYRGEHVVGVIQRLEESGQSVDFNAVLDRLNGHPSGGSQRGWSG